jgi:hypothetical protein
VTSRRTFPASWWHAETRGRRPGRSFRTAIGLTRVRIPASIAPVNYPTLPRSGLTRPSLVEGGASCFCVGTCIRGGHSGSRLHGRLPFTGGSECPTPTGWTLGHNRHCALLVALEQCRRRGERHTTTFDHVGSKAWPRSESSPMTALYPPYRAPCPLARTAVLLEGGGLAPQSS